MDGSSYCNFDLLIQRIGTGYRAQVVESPTGQAEVEFARPFSRQEFDDFLSQIDQPRRRGRSTESPLKAARDFGGRLFEAVFANDVRVCFSSSEQEAERQDKKLRIRLRLSDVPELADLPWEYLYYRAHNYFLALSNDTSLVRFLDVQEREAPLAVNPPLKVLVMISSPTDYPELDVEQEWEHLQKALGDLQQKGLVTLDRLDEATFEKLDERLAQGGHHVLHFIGHGAFDENDQDGVLVLENETEQKDLVSGKRLGMLLHNHRRSLRLAVLNACEGARGGKDTFTGVAQSFVQQGIPAVVAMQFEITDRAATTFTQAFYSTLAEGFPVDTALANARRAIFNRPGQNVEWGTPVLYLRSSDGRIFDVKLRGNDSPPVRPGPGEQPGVLPSSHGKARWIIRALVILVMLGLAVLGGRLWKTMRTAVIVPSPLPPTVHLLPGTQDLAVTSPKIEGASPKIEFMPRVTSPLKQRIDALLMQAQQQMSAQQLYSPAGNNALETYREILKIEPGQIEAQVRIQEIETQLKKRSKNPELLGKTEGGGPVGKLPKATDGKESLLIPAGEFWMGCDEQADRECEHDEKPGRMVSVDAFSIDKQEVTMAEYRRCVEAGGCTSNGLTEYEACNWNKTGRDNHPINCINWDQAKAYCEWAGKRLPSEAEWEKAARGTDRRRYPWGNQWDNQKAHTDSSSGRTVPVGSYSTGLSPYQVQDMIGNVSEWVQDWYDQPYYADASSQNPQGPDDGSSKVLRGGGWLFSARPRVSARYSALPDYRHAHVGIRCAQ